MGSGAVGPTTTQSATFAWIQTLANVAAALTLLLAAYQFYANTKAQRIQNSLSVLSDGRQLQQQYQEGKAEARDIVTFYYRVYVSRDVLDARIIRPLERSLCSTVIEDPRVSGYWDDVNKTEVKRYFVDDFVEHMNDIRSKKKLCE